MRAQPTRIRRLYEIRYAFRLLVLAFTVAMYVVAPQSFSVLTGLDFVRSFSWLHLLWVVWVVDMLSQLVPTRGYFAVGSLKHFKIHYVPFKLSVDNDRLKRFFRRGHIDSLKVLGIWIAVVAVIGALRVTRVVAFNELLLISVFFYVLDLTFVLWWCPIRSFILKNRCCTTCRIFNWDHMMMFSPLLFIPGLFSLSLFGLAVVVFLVWEVGFTLHPERFWEDTNAALRCHNCSDRLCGQEGYGA
jgi:hypothetical protein